ncbi:Protein of unknown function [Pyronema omphalodes CBS 100304]|uniref:Uncharacterized protein n=1 Tax=Pyronema omphalodes (strain CBS 100304) TaxID=1076935 RepID=U4L732_PYROM|nr:Protein of unknown function [Pyronema omphalodes CBS 100304]
MFVTCFSKFKMHASVPILIPCTRDDLIPKLSFVSKKEKPYEDLVTSFNRFCILSR